MFLKVLISHNTNVLILNILTYSVLNVEYRVSASITGEILIAML